MAWIMLTEIHQDAITEPWWASQQRENTWMHNDYELYNASMFRDPPHPKWQHKSPQIWNNLRIDLEIHKNSGRPEFSSTDSALNNLIMVLKNTDNKYKKLLYKV